MTEKGVIDINPYFSEVQLSNEAMRNSFNVTELTITNSGLKSYPYRVTATIDGIKYFTVCDEVELEEYFPELIKRSDKNV